MRTPGNLLFVVAFAVFVAHASVYGDWIVDDAGISFAYARDLAHGHGLVAQPGLEPVEGYSNPLWVFAMALFYALHLFHEVWTPKLVSVGLIGLCFFLLNRTLVERLHLSPLSAGCVLLLTALNPGFVIWCCSGLENPLYALLCVALLDVCARQAGAEGASPRFAWIAALLALACGLTRPGGAVFALVFPAVLLLATPGGRGARAWKALGLYAGVLLVPGLAFLGFRWAYFGALLPNTYYAKQTPVVENLLRLFVVDPPRANPLYQLGEAVAGPAAPVMALVLLASVCAAALRRRFRPADFALGAMLAASMFIFAALPRDWMGEYRFGTPFFPFFYAAVLVCVERLASSLEEVRRRRVAQVAVVALLASTAALAAPRVSAFARRPTVPLDSVEAQAASFEKIAAYYGLEDYSVLHPDIGGLLLEDRFRVVDLGGVTDPRIARTLCQGDLEGFHDYIFEDVRPTILFTHPVWTRLAALRSDPRLDEYYEPGALEGPGYQLRRKVDLYVLRERYR